MGFGRRLPDTYFTEEIVASYLPKRELLCEALRAVGFTLCKIAILSRFARCPSR